MIVPVLVVRCCDYPEAPVPSKIVECEICGADCWLSIFSGDATMALARSMGTPGIICQQCFWPLQPRLMGEWN